MLKVLVVTSPSGLAGPAHSRRCPSLVPRVPNSKPCGHPIPIRGTSAGAGELARGRGEHSHGLHEGSWHVSLLSPSSRELTGAALWPWSGSPAGIGPGDAAAPLHRSEAAEEPSVGEAV